MLVSILSLELMDWWSFLGERWSLVCLGCNDDVSYVCCTQISAFSPGMVPCLQHYNHKKS